MGGIGLLGQSFDTEGRVVFELEPRLIVAKLPLLSAVAVGGVGLELEANEVRVFCGEVGWFSSAVLLRKTWRRYVFNAETHSFIADSVAA